MKAIPRYDLTAIQDQYQSCSPEILHDLDTEGDWCKYEDVAPLEARLTEVEKERDQALDAARVYGQLMETYLRERDALSAELKLAREGRRR